MQSLARTLKEEESLESEAAVERLEESGVKRGSGRQCVLTGIARNIRNQINTGTISRRTLRWILDRGTEHLWTCPECVDVVP